MDSVVAPFNVMLEVVHEFAPELLIWYCTRTLSAPEMIGRSSSPKSVVPETNSPAIKSFINSFFIFSSILELCNNQQTSSSNPTEQKAKELQRNQVFTGDPVDQ